MSNTTPIKAGFLGAPCRIAMPGEKGANSVVKVTKIDRDDNTTHFHGIRVMTKGRIQLDVSNCLFIKVI